MKTLEHMSPMVIFRAHVAFWTLALLAAVNFQFSRPISAAPTLEKLTWQEQFPMPGEALRGVIHGNGRFVAVGDSGTILISTNGMDWVQAPGVTEKRLNAITCSGTLFVIVGDEGTILTSPDGESWTSQTVDSEKHLNGVAYGNGRFVASVDTSGERIQSFFVSDDGFEWIHYSLPEELSLGDRIGFFAHGSFVVTGKSIYTSPDGIEWTHRLGRTSWIEARSDVSFTAGAPGEDRLVVVGPASPMGGGGGNVRSFSEHFSAVGVNSILAEFTGISFGENIWVASGRSVSGWIRNPPTLSVSADAVNWSSIPATQRSLNSITHGLGRFVAVGDNGVIITMQAIPDATLSVTFDQRAEVILRGRPGRTYRIEATDQLAVPLWQPVTFIVPDEPSSTGTWVDPESEHTKGRFYRAILE